MDEKRSELDAPPLIDIGTCGLHTIHVSFKTRLIDIGTCVAFTPYMVHLRPGIDIGTCGLHTIHGSFKTGLIDIGTCGLHTIHGSFKTGLIDIGTCVAFTPYMVHFFFIIFFYANHPLQGFRSHCSVRGYYSLRSPLPGPKPLLGQGDNTHTHTHTQPPTQPFITSKHDMKSLLVREQVDGSTVLSTKTKYIQGHSTKLLLPEGTMV